MEGVSDKAVIARLIIELRNSQMLANDNILIDTAADLPDAAGGNRSRVENMHTTIGGSRKFAAVVDREFRRFDMQNGDDNDPKHIEIPDHLFWTRGHSIENYFVDAELVTACLEQHYPEHLPGDYRDLVNASFPSILKTCASITLALEPTNPNGTPPDRLQRVSTAGAVGIWQVQDNGEVSLNDQEFDRILRARGFTQLETSMLLQRRLEFMNRLEQRSVAVSRWLCHGHLGIAFLWSAIGALLLKHGMPSARCQDVAFQNREAHRRGTVEQWSRACVSAARADSPVPLLQWLRAS
ncbi:MAG: DUF4435 domain-containing protein [Tepidisphaeraceae bacterium]